MLFSDGKIRLGTFVIYIKDDLFSRCFNGVVLLILIVIGTVNQPEGNHKIIWHQNLENSALIKTKWQAQNFARYFSRPLELNKATNCVIVNK